MDDDQLHDDSYIEGEAADVAASAFTQDSSAEPDPFAEKLALGGLIRSYRRLAGWSQENLSHESNVNPEMITRIESGKIRRPQNFTLERLSSALARQLGSLTAQEILADFQSARDARPFANAPDPAAALISARLRPYSERFRKLAYDAISDLLDALEGVIGMNA